jgi:hypothetical protein
MIFLTNLLHLYSPNLLNNNKMKLKSILLLSATLIAAQAEAQTHVATNGKKYVLLEEATGAWCGWCPDGAQIIEQTIEPMPNTIIASFHNSHHSPYAPDDDMELTGDPFFSTGYMSGFPMGTVDRTSFGTGIGQNRGAWASDVTTNLALTPKFDVNMDCTYDPATSKLTIKITGKALAAGTGQWNVNAYLVEDSISSAATGNYVQHSYLYSTSSSWFYNLCAMPCPTYACTSCAYLPAANYAHMNVVEKIFGAGIYGDKLFTNPAVGDTASKTYSYTVPAKFIGSNGGTGWTINYKHLKVIGLIEKYGTTTTDRAIENSIQSNVKSMWTSVLGVSSVTTELQDVSIFPNPASNNINVTYTVGIPSESKISIKNIVGQVVLEKTYPARGNQFDENIPLNNFSNGVYFMNIESNGATTTKEFTVNK